MKGGIEKVTKSVQLIRRFWYFSLSTLFLISIFIFNIASRDRFHINVDSARYLLSALVQSQAAIVAIVVTLTLIAVQLAASSYSPRVIDIFKKNPTMWILLSGYGVSIFFGLFVLEMIQDEDPSQTILWNFHNIFISLESFIYLAYWLGVFTFVLLVLHMREIIDILNPSKIIKRLSEDITKENVLKFIESEEKQKEDRTKPIEEDSIQEEDPIQPIMDVIHSSIMKYDIATTRIGLKVVTDRTIEIIDSDSQKEISTCFCDHLERVSTLTVNKMDEESTGEVIRNLANFGRLTAERELEDATSQVARSLGDVGNAAAEKGLEGTASGAAWHLKVVGRIAAEKEFGGTAFEAAWSLGRVGEIAIEKGFGYATKQAIQSLGSVGTIAAERELEDATSQVARSLGDVGKAAAEREFEDVTFEATRFLRVVGEIAAEKGLEDAAFHVAWSLGYVGESVVKREFEGTAFEVARSLELIGKVAADKELEDATKQAAWSLELIGRVAVEKELEDIAKVAVRCLAGLTISCKGSVENAIKNSKSASEERDRKSFQKFINLYEDELEKLRTQNID